MTSWSDIVRHEDPVEVKKSKTIPFGWVHLSKDPTTWHTIITQNENDPTLTKPPFDWDKEMSTAIRKMRIRWDMHHYLAGTYFDYDDVPYDPYDDMDSDDECTDSESDEEQNGHLAGGSRYNDELS
tara:strand:+ start:841 stop:1218 length:378 start_codon:yes stop_codon:yes gene_type:complete